MWYAVCDIGVCEDALRAGSDGWAQQTGCTIGGTAQLALRAAPPPSTPPDRATFRVTLRPDEAVVGWYRERPPTTRTALLSDPLGERAGTAFWCAGVWTHIELVHSRVSVCMSL